MGTCSPASPLRYPGGKQCLSAFVAELIRTNEMTGCTYAEPYAGGAGLALRLLMDGVVGDVLLNDKCPMLTTFWMQLFHNTDALLRKVDETPVTMEEWHRTREITMRPTEFAPLQVAFAFFFQNRTNFSGVINGGVIGGKGQAGQYRLDARYPKARLLPLMERVASLRERVSIFNLDALDFLEREVACRGETVFTYCDPPYFVKGQGLYLNAYRPEDHAEVSNYLHKQPRMRWIVSYDNVPKIAVLYAQDQLFSFDLPYSAHQKRRGKELMVLSPQMRAGGALQRLSNVSRIASIPIIGK